MKPEEIQKLSDDELSIKVAEFCGWWWLQDAKGHKRWLHPEHKERSDGILYDEDGKPMPNYPQDLNAMHVAEKLIKPNDRTWAWYLHWLGIVADCGAVHATARQKAEAFVLTMNS